MESNIILLVAMAITSFIAYKMGVVKEKQRNLEATKKIQQAINKKISKPIQKKIVKKKLDINKY